MDFAQAVELAQTFAQDGISLKVTSALNGKRRIMGPCPYCYYQLTVYNRTAEPTDMPGYHRVKPPITFNFNPTNGRHEAIINLECDKKQDMGFVLERGEMQRLLEREGFRWWEVKGGF